MGQVRRPGGGRKRVTELNPAVRKALLALVEPDVRGDPMSPLRWTTKSTRRLAEKLTRQGHRVCADMVGDLLREEGFSLHSNAKTLEGRQHPDRDAQFHYLNEQARDHQDGGAPVISVDTKKKELVGPFKNNGREWEQRGEPVRGDTHDFPDRELAYDSRAVRHELQRRRILPVISHKGAPHIKGLGKPRYVVERTFALLHQFKRLAVRWERRRELHEAVVSLACALICWRRLKPTHS